MSHFVALRLLRGGLVGAGWLEQDNTRGSIILCAGLALIRVWLRMRVRLPVVEPRRGKITGH